MSVTAEIASPIGPVTEARAILGPGGNRVRVSEDSKRRKEGLKKPLQKVKRSVLETPVSAARSNLSVDSTCSSGSSNGCSSVKVVKSRPRLKAVNVVVDAGVDAEMETPPAAAAGPIKRCDWITSNSDQLHATFHDEEWGYPVRDDRKLFELLILSLALAEYTWPAILTKREIFRKLFDNFDPACVANFTEKKLLSLRSNGRPLLSESKLRAVVENANQTLKVQQEFGSFSNYCWRFVNHKPIRNGFRYARQLPVKTPKAEVISKDLMQRGFRCVGPSVVYSFMQASGMVNDHLVTCFRYHQCNNNNVMKVTDDASDQICLSQD